MTPSTLTQVAILVAFVLPGSVYQAVRARLAGEVPANRDLSNRILRALAASVVLDGLYGIVLGPTLARLIGGNSQSTGPARHWLIDHVRPVSLLGLLLLFVAPTAFAYFAARRYAVGDWIARSRERGPLSSTWGRGRTASGTAACTGQAPSSARSRKARRCSCRKRGNWTPTVHSSDHRTAPEEHGSRALTRRQSSSSTPFRIRPTPLDSG
jgi:hypothetical protein